MCITCVMPGVTCATSGVTCMMVGLHVHHRCYMCASGYYMFDGGSHMCYMCQWVSHVLHVHVRCHMHYMYDITCVRSVISGVILYQWV